ncbi:hypothetical protein C8A03DRAFT_43438 [Achaetomium macrosporum]|uniref:Uncharacterized protein n=1 Tax=Achaetomium macrosporum TaxID=79813 RepID=A0AAN7CBC2_9PEZI|nr:hypothetical protein C8A03DRAFT_43438 [Achaetomium macrosporum]
MSKALRCAALSCALGLAEAKALNWRDDGPTWVPARETFGMMPRLGLIDPTPTPAPAPQVEPRKVEARASTDNTCGYMRGILTSSLYCDPTAYCIYNEANKHIGCCDDTATTKCPVWTTCYDSTDSAKYTTSNGLTLWCGDSQYPYCWTHTYADPVFTGYTVINCGVAAGTGPVYYTPLTSSTSSSSDSSSTTSTTSTSSISDSTSTSSSSTSPPNRTDPPSDGSSSTPVGPIVGGVVGGLGAIAMILLGIWALIRHNNKQKSKAAEAAAAAAAAAQQHHSQPPLPPGAGHQDPHMSQYYGAAAGAGFSPMDPRASVAKPPVYAPSMGNSPYGPGPDHAVSSVGGSPPHSPSPGYHPHGTPSPPPQPGQFGQQQQPQAYGDMSPGAAYQQQGQQGYGAGGNGYQQHYAAELPATRGDGELRELQG